MLYNKNKTKVVAIKHHPMETLRAEKTKSGVIKAYYYHPDWSNKNYGDNSIILNGNGRIIWSLNNILNDNKLETNKDLLLFIKYYYFNLIIYFNIIKIKSL